MNAPGESKAGQRTPAAPWIAHVMSFGIPGALMEVRFKLISRHSLPISFC
jgi:hypothetical protein